MPNSRRGISFCTSDAPSNSSVNCATVAVDDAKVSPEWRWLQDKTEQERLDETVPLLEDADKIDIVVVGADRAKTLVMPTAPSAVTVGIDQYRA